MLSLLLSSFSGQSQETDFCLNHKSRPVMVHRSMLSLLSQTSEGHTDAFSPALGALLHSPIPLSHLLPQWRPGPSYQYACYCAQSDGTHDGFRIATPIPLPKTNLLHKVQNLFAVSSVFRASTVSKNCMGWFSCISVWFCFSFEMQLCSFLFHFIPS